MSETVTEELIYEYWDCDRCGQKGIRGDIDRCIQCGTPRNDSTKFYRKEEVEEEKVTDTEQAKKFEAGPDWLCSFCNSLNSSLEEKCRSCGASKSDSEANYFDLQKKREAAENAKKKEPEEPPKSNKLWYILGAVAIFLIGFIWWGTGTHAEKYHVEKVHWEISVPVMRYKTVTTTDWENNVSGDEIKRIKSFQDIKGYEKRQVGTRTESYTDTEQYQSGTKNECSTSYKSTGSGASKKIKTCKDVPVYSNRQVTKTRAVPVYKEFPIFATKVTYSAKKYVLFDTERAKGKDNNPQEPKVKLGTGENDKPDKKDKSKESYFVLLESKSNKKGPKEVILSTPKSNFEKKYKLGADLEFKVNNFGNLTLEKEETIVEKKDSPFN